MRGGGACVGIEGLTGAGIAVAPGEACWGRLCGSRGPSGKPAGGGGARPASGGRIGAGRCRGGSGDIGALGLAGAAVLLLSGVPAPGVVSAGSGASGGMRGPPTRGGVSGNDGAIGGRSGVAGATGGEGATSTSVSGAPCASNSFSLSPCPFVPENSDPPLLCSLSLINSAVGSSIELECVFLSERPSSASKSSTALVGTSSCLASSLIRTLLIVKTAIFLLRTTLTEAF